MDPTIDKFTSVLLPTLASPLTLTMVDFAFGMHADMIESNSRSLELCVWSIQLAVDQLHPFDDAELF